MDLSMPVMNGIEATRRIVADLPDTQIIGLSMYEESDQAEAMLAAGAKSYLSKGGPSQDLIAAIRRIGRTSHPLGELDRKAAFGHSRIRFRLCVGKSPGWLVCSGSDGSNFRFRRIAAGTVGQRGFSVRHQRTMVYFLRSSPICMQPFRTDDGS